MSPGQKTLTGFVGLALSLIVGIISSEIHGYGLALNIDTGDSDTGLPGPTSMCS